MTTRFVIDPGVVVPAVTASQMRALDRVAVDGSGPSIQQMMENAGRTLAELALETTGVHDGVFVLVGSGGNGGGGLCAARHLANRGVGTRVVIATHHLGSVAAQQLELFRQTGHPIERVADLEQMHPGVVVDALLGYGLHGPPRGDVLRCIRWANNQAAPIIALDVPSGIDATSGEAPGEAIRATRTLTLALPKTGLTAANTGELWLADLGIPRGVYRAAGFDIGNTFKPSALVRLHRMPHGS